VGVGEGEQFVASDVPAILGHTRTVTFLEDGDVIVASAGRVEISDLQGRPRDRHPVSISWSPAMAEKGGFKHFMLKEIFEQPQALINTIQGRLSHETGAVYLDELGVPVDALRLAAKVTITACGTSWHAGLVGKFLIERLARVPVEVDIASEYRYRDPIVAFYLSLYLFPALLILFGAVWLSLYLARRITAPLRLVAEGAERIAAGERGVRVDFPSGNDEFTALIASFNRMSERVARSEEEVELSRSGLSRKNHELEERRRLMETVLETVGTGVVVVDAEGTLTARTRLPAGCSTSRPRSWAAASTRCWPALAARRSCRWCSGYCRVASAARNGKCSFPARAETATSPSRSSRCPGRPGPRPAPCWFSTT